MEDMEYHHRIPDHPYKSTFIHEVNQDLRAEQLQRLWQRYSHFILILVLFLIILMGGYGIWEQWHVRKVAASALRYAEASRLIESDHAAEGTAILAALTTEADGGYQVLATLRLAAVFAKQNANSEVVKALAVWRRAAADPTVPRPYREAAALLTALNGIEIVSYDEIYYLLSPLLIEKSPWRFLALEITAVLAIRQSDFITAHVILTRLSDDLQAPASVRGRASTLRQTLPLFALGQDHDAQ